MARARNIKPGFFRNEILAELPPLTRLLFAGLWTIADKAGRLEDRPKRIKADVLPYDDGDVDEMLTQLHDAAFIIRYGAGNARYIQVANFGKHQNPHVKEGDSTIPAPGEMGEHPTSTVQTPDKNGASFPLTDSLNLIPDSLISDSRDTSADALTKSRKKDELSEVQSQRFNRWYQSYPRKVSKAEAVKAWAKITPAPTDELTERMIAKVEEWVNSDEWADPQYIPHPATWLNAGRWDDGPPVPRSVPNGSMRLMNGGNGTPGPDGRTDAERGYRLDPGPKGWSANEMAKRVRDLERNERSGT